MQIAEIKTNSTAEVKGHFTDIIYFQGCPRNCCYCFNPQLKAKEGGLDYTPEEVIDRLSHLSNVVVLTGGEPLMNYEDLKFKSEFISLLSALRERKKIIVLETSLCEPEIWAMCDKVLYCIKTWDINEAALSLYITNKIIPVVVYGHSCFDKNGFTRASFILEKIYIRSYNDEKRDMSKAFALCKNDYEVFEQLIL